MADAGAHSMSVGYYTEAGFVFDEFAEFQSICILSGEYARGKLAILY